MSTRGLIAIMDDDGSCRSIYCHHDMYPSHAGVVLPEHYATREAVEAFLALGDLSALGCSLAECEAYCRERSGTAGTGWEIWASATKNAFVAD